jgi:hypothetical protein
MAVLITLLSLLAMIALGLISLIALGGGVKVLSAEVISWSWGNLSGAQNYKGLHFLSFLPT